MSVWFRSIAALTALVLAVPVGGAARSQAASAAAPAPISRAVPAALTSLDVGFAEGANLHDADLDRRLDGIAAYVPGRSPIIRVDLDWWYLEPCRGCALAWDRLDPVVDAATARGARVLITLAYAPPWANGGHANDKWFPVADADWTSIVERVVQRYGDRVQAYEVWNEPNLAAFGDYSTDRKTRYWQLVRLAYERIHAGCATCVVLAGASGGGSPVGPTGNPNESAAWLAWGYDRGYGRYFDAVAHHPYPAWNSGKGPSDPECANRWWNMFGPPAETPACGELAYVHSVMVAHADGAKKIWATEWGYPTSGATATGLASVRDRAAEGVQLWRALPYAGPLFLYSYRDGCVNTADPECNFGVVNRNFEPKGILFDDLSTALTEAWRPVLGGGQSLRRWASLLSQDGGFQAWLQGDGNLVLYRRYGAALWATNTRGAVALVNKPDGNLVLNDAAGRTLWSTGTAGNGPSKLWQQEDGNLVLYRDSDGKSTWESHTMQS